MLIISEKAEIGQQFPQLQLLRRVFYVSYCLAEKGHLTVALNGKEDSWKRTVNN